MENQLSPDQSAALAASPEARLTIVDPSTRRWYVLISADELARLENLDAIGRGISQMESGQGQPLGDAMSEIRQSLKSES